MPPSEVAAAYEDVVAALGEHADAQRAGGQQMYLKLDRAFFGVRVPDVRRLTRAAVAAHRIAGHDQVVALATRLWGGPRFECRLAAVIVLSDAPDTLGPADLVWLETWIRDGETWALVDELAARVVGTIVERHADATGAVLDRWAADPDSFWVRRAAMLALLVPLRRGDGQWERFCGYADAMLDEREFFIRKAIGWVLRDTARRRPELVRAWVEPRLARMSGVTRREALKYL